jgi:putative ABC transport system permease protein
VEEGEPFSPEDVSSRAKVTLIGSTTAARLFGDESPLGAQLFIDNVAFEVTGVLETIGVDPHGNDQDHVIWTPYTTLMEDILKIDYVSGVTFTVEDRERVPEIGEEIAEIMRRQHQIVEGQNDDFSVLTSEVLYEFFNRSFRTVSLFVPLIVGTAFLVSAFIILSIMQVTIKERTPEIGLRKAMGARPRDLEIQILLEVLVLAIGACLVGVVLAQLGSAALAPLLEEKMGVRQLTPSFSVIALAALGAVATGVLGAILPARRAARLDPVKALK